MSEIQAQAPICPFCFDDHASGRSCREADLKRVIMKIKLTEYSDIGDEGQARDLDRMIEYF